jgi:hypothetical protein
MGEIKFARVRDFLDSNSLIINPTSRVIRDKHLPESLRNDTQLRDDALVTEILRSRPKHSAVDPQLPEETNLNLLFRLSLPGKTNIVFGQGCGRSA